MSPNKVGLDGSAKSKGEIGNNKKIKGKRVKKCPLRQVPPYNKMDYHKCAPI